MGYMMLLSPCISCGQTFSCNPDLVPSIRINGVREPLCRECAERWEEIHDKHGTIRPGAYEPQEVT